MPLEVKVEGAEEVRRRLIRMAGKVPNEVARALYEEALIEAKESRRRTPVDTGALRGSHKTNTPKVRGRNIEVTIEVGGPAAPYAPKVHYDIEADHKVGQALFLQSTIDESRPHLPSRVARRIDFNRINS